jgi:DNA-binding LacI/PurR family transcriptional regulator
VVCFHNTLARYVAQAALERGLDVPRDLSVFGGGGEEVFGLTCAQIDWYEMGREAMRMLLRAVESGPGAAPEHLVVPYDFRPGRTTAPPTEEG